MSKIIAVINTMISNSNKISKVISGENELFFLYDNKYKWSIRQLRDGEYSLFYYAGAASIEQLASFVGPEWSDYPFVTYSTAELKTREASESMQELYRIIREKLVGVDEAFDDIISGS